MDLGILSVRQDKAGFLEKRRTPVRIKETFQTQIAVTVAEFAYSRGQWLRMTKHHRERLIQKGIALLKKENVSAIILTKECEKEEWQPDDEKYLRIPLSSAVLPACIKFALDKTMEVTQKRTLGVIDPKMEKINFAVLSELCLEVGSIFIFTECTEKAEQFGEKLCDEYGFFPEIRSLSCVEEETMSVTVNMERGYVQIKKGRIIDGAAAILDLHGYHVDPDVLMKACPQLHGCLPVYGWMCGKKLLTRT